jgi:hypothetical protein
MQDGTGFTLCVNTLLWIRMQLCCDFAPGRRIFELDKDAGAWSATRGIFRDQIRVAALRV